MGAHQEPILTRVQWRAFFLHYVLFFLLYYAFLYGLIRLGRWMAC